MKQIKDQLALGVRAAVKSWPTYDGGQLDRSRFITSSEVGKCMRMVKYGKVYPERAYDDENWGYAERGHAGEAWMVDNLIRSGMELLYAGDGQVSFYAGCQSGTPDAVEEYREGLWLYELKTIDPRVYFNNLPRSAHVDQLFQNMDVVAASLDTPVYGGSLFYLDASDFQKSRQYDYNADHKKEAALQERAEYIHAAASPEALPTEGMTNGDCDHCPFTEECSQAIAEEFKVLHGVGKGVFK